MPASKQKNRLLRVLVPVIAIAVGIGFVLGVTGQFSQGSGSGQGDSDQQQGGAADADGPIAQADTQPQAPTDNDPAEEPAAAPPDPTAQTPQAEPEAPAAEVGETAQPTGTGPLRLRARAVPGTDDQQLAPIGSLSGVLGGSGYRLEVVFTHFGAGVKSITLADEFATIEEKVSASRGQPAEHEVIQKLSTIGTQDVTSLAAIELVAIRLGGRQQDVLRLYGRDGVPVWRSDGPGRFVCEIEDEAGALVATIVREYELNPGSYELICRQTVENHTDETLGFKLVQNGPTDLHIDFTGFRFDTRRVRIGHLFEASRDPQQQEVTDSGKLLTRDQLLKAARADQRGATDVWPDPARYKSPGPVVWIAQTGRHHTFAVHPLIDIPPQPTAGTTYDKAFALADRVFALGVFGPDPDSWADDRLVVQMLSRPIEVAPRSSEELHFAAYAGPKSRSELKGRNDPIYRVIELDHLLVYNLGGMCAFCTFQWLARGLLALLEFYEGITLDWSIAIVLLVVTVRVLLHPITRRSQISMLKFGKQMQRLQPKMKKIQEKYKDDRARTQQETMKLFREERVNPVGMLGCLPMFLQSPVWIALYAMLYFAFEIRHEAAFYGIFQAVSGGNWLFLADLSAPDRFIDFGRSLVTIPIMGDIRSINLLPLLMAVLFYVQQKYLTPQSTATLTPEQQQQQKIMKVLLIGMMPIFLYNAPAGLAVYFITNSTLGIIEMRWIRAHVDALDLDSPPPPKPTPQRGRKAEVLSRPGGKVIEGGKKYKKRR